MKKNYQVFVISQSGKPLMPTKRFGKVRRLLKSGMARVVSRKPFTIQLQYKTEEYKQDLILGIDPGAEHIACVVRRVNGEIVYAGELQSRSREVTELMSERRMYRRSRRQHRRKKKQRRAKREKTCFQTKNYQISGMEKSIECKWIKPGSIRFHNRGRSQGWLTATSRHLLETHKNFVSSLSKFIGINKVSLEYAKFDIHKLDKPEVSGVEYQNGRKKGYGNLQNYVLCRDKHTCQRCEKNSKNTELQVHHVVWQSHGGSDCPENLITLCSKCHTKVHKNPKTDTQVKELFKGIKKRFVHTTLLNTIMPSFYNWLQTQFRNVTITYGYRTKEKRLALDLEKDHVIDAYLISFEDESDTIATVKWSTVLVYKYQQFRRHHRQIIHAVRDRNYKLDNKIVAKNRRKRTGQLTDSLQEFIENNGKAALSSLRILRGKKVKRSIFNDFRKGDIVRYGGQCLVVKGYGQMGRQLGFVGHKNYVPAKHCQLLIRNTGIVCL